MKKLLLILLCLPMIGFGQVIIPDVNFKAYLVGNSSINTNGDTEIQLSEATAFNGSIICANMNIDTLIGIEAFTALTYLNCGQNQLTSFDLGQNTALTKLHCYENEFISLDVSNNTALTNLYCYNNNLTSLDISSNTSLNYLDCGDNQLTSLDVSQNTSLTYLRCDNNQLTTLDVIYRLYILECYNNQLTSLDIRNGYNSYLGSFNCTANPNLTCINVDDSVWSTINWTVIDPQHYFSNNCSGTGIQEHSTNKKLLRTIDILGRETKNTPLFYIYDDGTVKKRITIE